MIYGISGRKFIRVTACRTDAATCTAAIVKSDTWTFVALTLSAKNQIIHKSDLVTVTWKASGK